MNALVNTGKRTGLEEEIMSLFGHVELELPLRQQGIEVKWAHMYLSRLEKSACKSCTFRWSWKTGHGKISGEKIQGRREVLGLTPEVPQHLKR